MIEPALPSIADRFPRRVLAVRLLLLGTLALLLAGLFAPIITLEKLLFVRNTFSLASGLVQLLGEGQVLVFLLVGGFSVLLPLAKLVMLFLFVGRHWADRTRLRRYVGWMHRYGRWSMLDVFVVAVLVATIKLGAVANVQVHYGLYLFAAAVLLTMAATAWVMRLADALEREAGA